MRRDPARQPGHANLRFGSSKQLLTDDEVATITDLWARGWPVHAISERTGVAQCRLLARLDDQLATACPRRGRGFHGDAWKADADAELELDPSPREIRLAAAVIRRSWPTERWGDVAPPDDARQGRTSQPATIRRAVADFTRHDPAGDGGHTA
jgi:hypothetical protein